MKMQSIREEAVAGTFYPANPQRLRTDIHHYLDEASPPVSPEHPVGIISPHAGYVYSGGTAAYGYKLLCGKRYKRVIVFALSHRVEFRGASIFDGSAYKTPLGIVPVDVELVDKLRKESPIITYSPFAHQVEHSLEVQIPFLQEVLDEFLLVPILLRVQSLEVCRKVVDALLAVLPEDEKASTLVVGSTDLYHGPDYDECRRRDKLLAETVKQFDEKAFEEKIYRGEIMACGPASVMATMLLSRSLGATRADILHLTNSYDVAHESTDYIVGYLSAIFY